MTATVFDTHAVVKRLKAAGFTEQQAEAHAETLKRSVASSPRKPVSPKRR